MNQFWAIFIVFMAFFVLMSLRIFIKKEPGFRGTCASNNPALKNDLGECKMCGKKPTEDCKDAQQATV